MKDLAVIAYTHTDMEDVWNAFFERLKMFLPLKNVYVAVNKKSNLVPKEYKQITYDDTQLYTKRWIDILDQVEESTILFLHEDMIMYDHCDLQLLEKYVKYVQDDTARSIKLICTDFGNIRSHSDQSLIESTFSIQPTIIKKDSFKKIIDEHGFLNIWDLERSITIVDRDYMVKLGQEKKRGLYHYDSIIFPYIATAISKGKWNYAEYENELDSLFEEYSIDPVKRGLI